MAVAWIYNSSLSNFETLPWSHFPDPFSPREKTLLSKQVHIRGAQRIKRGRKSEQSECK